ncbi:MAG TPA: oxidoreductase [Gammaproteobacteria bacterium]|nr:oxidoreductase [Gammaproteobacteria bacterium]|tara:strand:- start:2102 stop:3094 length:993 start_codon:yes stop_codon:yes gene_type:complete
MEKGLIAISGATGFLGTALVKHFLNKGYRVRAHAHTEDKARQIDRRVEDIVIGEISDDAMITELVTGADFVIHTVSNFRYASGKAESYRRINVTGTKFLIDAAVVAGVKRFVHCSTIGVHGDVAKTPATEDSPFNPGDLYQETKLESEEYVRSKMGKSDMEIVVIRPCSMYGPGDLRMLKMFKMLSKGRFFFLGKCKENFHAVYIEDVVSAFAKAVEVEGIDGEVFIVGGPDGYLPLRGYVGEVAEALGAKPPELTFPYSLFYAAATLCEMVCVPLGIEPILHRRRVRFYKNNRAFDTSKAERVLGYHPSVSLQEGMKRTVAWYRERGLL